MPDTKLDYKNLNKKVVILLVELLIFYVDKNKGSDEVLILIWLCSSRFLEIFLISHTRSSNERMIEKFQYHA